MLRARTEQIAVQHTSTRLEIEAKVLVVEALVARHRAVVTVRAYLLAVISELAPCSRESVPAMALHSVSHERWSIPCLFQYRSGQIRADTEAEERRH